MFKCITEFESSMCLMSSLSYPLTRKIQDGIIHRVAISRIMMPHISAIFVLLQSLEYLTEASWSRVVPHRFTVSLGRRTQPTALVWHRNGHCKVPLGECVMPVRGRSLWGTISWNLQLLNTGGWSVPAPNPAPSCHIWPRMLFTVIWGFTSFRSWARRGAEVW